MGQNCTLGDVISFLIITLIVLISVTLDFVQEHRAAQAADRLRRSVAVHVRVLRDDRPGEIPLALRTDMSLISCAIGEEKNRT